MKIIHSVIKFLMEMPFFYKIVQVILGGQGHKEIKRYLLQQTPKSARKILDQGCGTGEYSLLFPGRYTGLDNNRSDIKYASKKYLGNFVVGSADKMSFKSRSFDLTFAVGLHHHLPEKQAKNAVKEAIRVTKVGGKVIIVDALLPNPILNPIGYFLRKIDRGRFVRKKEQTLELIPKSINYRQRILYGFPLDYVAIIIDN